jgi:hypothetical protein
VHNPQFSIAGGSTQFSSVGTTGPEPEHENITAELITIIQANFMA